MNITRVGDFTTTWGESLVWDERRSRLYFVDVLANTIHWLDGDSTEPQGLSTPQMPSGMVATQDGRLVVTFDDGLYVVDVDRGEFSQVSAYPERIGGRCNDMVADLDGNLITGKLNLGPAEGSSWWYQPSTDTWKMIDDDIANTNGPTVAVLDGVLTLIIGDSSAHYFAYDYEPATGTVGPRRVFGDVTGMGAGGGNGVPDGATLDDAGGLWCALPGSYRLVRFTTRGYDATIDVPCEHPTDVTFGGDNLDRLYVTAINDGLYVVDGVGRGRVEPRAQLS
ncbi:MAG TPA: SMP-30/gluconolactonase/LRE family protein [Acidimicrobiales bacterium]|nr:SMP-30/gluconolactonase/LRE family protein [Acidimicrobiales bacterium]